MSTIEILLQKTESLPVALQREVVDFVDYLLARSSMVCILYANALKGFENDPVTYSKADIKN